VEEHHREAALKARSSIEHGYHDASSFRASLLSVPASARDAWLDLVLGISELPDDGPELPRGCVPYLPCSVDALLRLIDHAGVQGSDVFVDIGSGLGRATAFVHLLTRASAIGLEIQPALAHAARDLAARLRLSRIPCIEGDAAELAGRMTIGTVFFLYCPFGAERLLSVLEQLKAIACLRMVRVCCVDLPLPPCAWLEPDPLVAGDLAVYRSVLHPRSINR
jgi:SAM-dependent methyltransferase